MFAEHEPAGVIEGQAVRAWLPALEGCSTGIPAWLEKQADACSLLPLEHRIVRNIREEQTALPSIPHRALNPRKSVGEPFQLCLGRDQPIDSRIQPDDRSSLTHFSTLDAARKTRRPSNRDSSRRAISTLPSLPQGAIQVDRRAD